MALPEAREEEFDLSIEVPPLLEPIAYSESQEAVAYFSEQIEQADRVIIFSPHLDDAVLSCGSLLTDLLSKGKKIDIITVFTETSAVDSPLSRKLLAQGGFLNSQEEDIPVSEMQTAAALYAQARKAEDAIALQHLAQTAGKGSIAVQYLGFTDVAWRQDEDGHALHPLSPRYKVGNITAGSEHQVEAQLAERFADVKSLNAGERIAVLAPFARGGHIDHMLVRNAVAVNFPQTMYYLDFPYSGAYRPNVEENIFLARKKLNEQAVSWRGDYSTKRTSMYMYQTQRRSFIGWQNPMQLPYERYFVPKQTRR